MHQVYADFNTMNIYTGRNDHLVDERKRVWLNPQPFFQTGLHVVLFQDDDDFEVEGIIERDTEHNDSSYRGWYAVIDWSTRRDL